MFELKQYPESKPVGLRSTGGAPTPPALGDELVQLLELPAVVKKRFWEVLAPYLGGEPSAAEQARLGGLCEEWAIDAQRLVAPIRAVRFLLQHSARTGISKEAFVEDLGRVVDNRNLLDVIAVVLPCFERAMPVLRGEITARSVSDQSRLVFDTNWRIDRVLASEHGTNLALDLAVVTFHYQEGNDSERVTLHLTAQQVAKLRQLCDAMLPGAP